MIKIISIEDAWEFYRKQKNNKEQLYFPTHGEFYGCFKEDNLKSIICILSFTSKKRITCLLTGDDCRGQGFANQLLKYVIKKYSNYTLTAFSTKNSRNLFIKNKFKIVSEKKFDITFLELEAK